jgi:hypothetical protein
LNIWPDDGLYHVRELVFPAGELFALPIDLLGAGCDAKIPRFSKDDEV